LDERLKGGGAPAAGETVEQAFERLLGEMRPKLHRYCARMTGSVIDGEDVVQEAQRNRGFPADGTPHQSRGMAVPHRP
jgi:hypothetical protein